MMTQLIFGDKRQININNWLGEERKKMNSSKYVNVIFGESHKEKLKTYNELVDNMKHCVDKYIKSLIRIQADGILEEIIHDHMIDKSKYFDESYNYVIQQKREEYIKKMKKKLKVEREIICPF